MKLTEEEIEEHIKEVFEENYEILRMQGGHAITADIKDLALNQVLYYYKKMREVAEKVTDTEVKLTLPDQRTKTGRSFTIEGVVDIVREDDETWMYDIKTHAPEYISANKEFYAKQLNVYAHIWQNLRRQPLEHTAIISTAYPSSLKNALQRGNLFAIQKAFDEWNPLIEFEFDQHEVQDLIEDFGQVVEDIETHVFEPAPIEKLKTKLEGTNTVFGTRVCRNCDARFSCESYRQFALESTGRLRENFKQYFDDYGSDEDQENWVEANLEQATPLLNELRISEE